MPYYYIIQREDWLMEQKKDLTRLLISNCFKELMLEYPFEKITIHMITDRAGIIRPTFYYHFKDKYELMEWILEEDIIRKMNMLLEQGMEREAIVMLFRCLHAERQYYSKAFEVTGQNGFEEVMGNRIEEMFLKEIKNRSIRLPYEQMLSNKIFAKYHSIALITFIKIWLKEGKDDTTLDHMVDTYQFLISHTIYDVLDIK